MSSEKALLRTRAPNSSTPTLYQVITGAMPLLASQDATERMRRAKTKAQLWMRGYDDFLADPQGTLDPAHRAFSWVCDQREALHRNMHEDWQLKLLNDARFFDFVGVGTAPVVATSADKASVAALPALKVKVKPNSRMAEVMERAVHAHLFPLKAANIGGCSVGDASVEDFFARAWFYEQAVRVRIAMPNGWSQAWWLLEAGNDDKACTSCMAIVVGRRRDEAAWDLKSGMHSLRLEGLSLVESKGYSESGGLMQLTLATAAGDRVQLDYDACLADQTHRGAIFMDIVNAWRAPVEPAPMISWRLWEAGPPVPKLASTLTTANAAFERSFQKLRLRLEQLRQDDPQAKVPDISWSVEREHYKFIEHLVLKCRQGAVPPSHLERVSALDFTWGLGCEHISKLIEVELRMPTGCKPFRAAATYEHRGSANQEFKMAA